MIKVINNEPDWVQTTDNIAKVFHEKYGFEMEKAYDFIFYSPLRIIYEIAPDVFTSIPAETHANKVYIWCVNSGLIKEEK